MGRYFTFRLGLIFVVLLLLIGSATPQNSLSSTQRALYDDGVTLFFRNKYSSAHDSFTSAISLGTNDPRYYYFRALCYAKLKHYEEAEADLQRGAKLEIDGIRGDFAIRSDFVASSLQRVQGPARAKIEKYRMMARIAANMEEQRKIRDRYEVRTGKVD